MASSLRFEVKIPIPLNRLQQVQIWLQSHPLLFKKSYPNRYVNSLYLDNANLDSYQENLSGVSHRRKIRIRWYQALEQSEQSTLEFKHRVAGKGYKISFPISFDISNPDFDWYQHLSQCYRQLPQEVKPIWGNEQLPILICRYHREYFESFCGRIRATIDDKIKVFDQRYYAHTNIRKSSAFGEYVLLELKADHQFEQQLSALISTCPLRPSRHSKYVIGVRHLTWI